MPASTGAAASHAPAVTDASTPHVASGRNVASRRHAAPGWAGLRPRLARHKYLYLLIAPALVLVFIFQYLPMYGVVIAFQDYRAADGFFDGDWVGLRHFTNLFTSARFPLLIRNTLAISLLKLVFGFPAPIILALLLNEISQPTFKKTVQTISFLPFFMSWVVLAGVVIVALSPQRGVVNNLIQAFGGTPIHFLGEPRWFWPVLVISGIWQSIGWGSVIYIATIAGIDPELYEAARVDGANRAHRAWHITLPGVLPVATILLLLNLGGILSADFDQVFNLYNPLLYEVGDIIDTYVVRRGLFEFKYSLAAAVNLFKNVVGLVLVISVNAFVRRVSEHGLW